MPQHTVRIIDSSGNPGRLKLRKVREHQAAGNGKFNEDGVYVFPRHHCNPNVGSIVVARRVTLSDILAALPKWPEKQTGKTPRLLVPNGFISYPQPSQCSQGARYVLNGSGL